MWHLLSDLNWQLKNDRWFVFKCNDGRWHGCYSTDKTIAELVKITPAGILTTAKLAKDQIDSYVSPIKKDRMVRHAATDDH